MAMTGLNEYMAMTGQNAVDQYCIYVRLSSLNALMC